MEQTTAVFDFNTIEDMPTGEVTIKDASGAATSMVVTLAGPENTDRKRRAFAKQRKFRAQWAKTQKMPTTDPVDDFDDETDELVACTLGWTGAAVPFSPGAARDLYSDPKRQWLRVQVKAALDERELFTRTSAAS